MLMAYLKIFVLFIFCFAIIIIGIWVFRPSAKKQLEDYAKIPLKENSEDGNKKTTDDK